MARASSIDTTPTATAAIALAAITRPRCGTSVNVVRPLRWLHSLVTDRIAIIGRMTAIGKPIAAAKVVVGELVVGREEDDRGGGEHAT